jgi:hypothetical protein
MLRALNVPEHLLLAWDGEARYFYDTQDTRFYFKHPEVSELRVKLVEGVPQHEWIKK